ncbi:Ribosomal protein S21 [Rhodopirellula sp. SWK7]|nr:Ribosomal protein S21 [Rhodopirellula sp. SWK7]
MFAKTPNQIVLKQRRFSNATNSKRRVYEADMVKLLVRDRETIQEAVRRFRKLVERSGIKKEMRRREFYEKPSETNRRARLRAERRNKRTQLLAR